MAKSNRPRRSNQKTQIIYSEPLREFKERYLTPKGKRVLAAGVIADRNSETGFRKITEKEVWEKYGKNRYTENPNAKPKKVVIHEIT